MNDSRRKTALVVGGGLAGLQAAKTISQAGHNVLLVEKEQVLGGIVRHLYSSFPSWEDPAKLLQRKLEDVGNCPRIQLEMGTAVVSSKKTDTGFLVGLQRANLDSREVEINAVVIATGLELFDTSVYGEYGYGIFPNVLNTLDFETRLHEWARGEVVSPPSTIAFFKCVGSRDRSKGYPYCSKICCMIVAKQAGLVRELLPQTKSYVFYTDYRASGKGYEEFVRSVIEEKHVRYVRGRPSKVLPDNGRLLIRTEDTLMGIPVELKADIIVLAAALQPSSGTRAMTQIFGLDSDPYGFLEPLSGCPALVGDRIFVAGACTFAVDTLSALQQGAAAGAGVIGQFNQED